VGSEVWLLEAPLGEGDEVLELPYASFYARKFWPGSLWRKFWPAISLENEKSLHRALLEAHEEDLFQSVRDVGDGGLAVSVAEACVGGDRCFGFEGDWSKTQKRRDLLLFGEGSGRAIVEISSAKRAHLMKLARDHSLNLSRLGSVTDGESFRLRPLCQGKVQELKESYFGCFR
jgi:phosphoribosylformylglycinamidine (FGAM) synthase-like enzyme